MLRVSGREVSEFTPELVNDDDDEEADDGGDARPTIRKMARHL